MDANSVAGLVSGVHFCSLMRYCVVTGSYGHELWPTVKPYSWGRAMLSIGCEQFAPRNSVVPPCTLCFSGSQGPRSSDGNKNSDYTSQARVTQSQPLQAKSTANGIPTPIVPPLSMRRQVMPAQHRRPRRQGVQ